MTAPDVAACIEAVTMLEESEELVQRLWRNAETMRNGLVSLGFDTGQSTTPIIPLMLGEASMAQDFSRRLFAAGIFVTATVYPTVPLGKARLRVMNSAAHSEDDLKKALEIFAQVGRDLEVID
jgi:glycine C-acetyltransferase